MMRGIERLLAVILLAAAVAGAVAFPRLLDPGSPEGPLALQTHTPGAPAVEAAPPPAPRRVVRPSRGPGVRPATRVVPAPPASPLPQSAAPAAQPAAGVAAAAPKPRVTDSGAI